MSTANGHRWLTSAGLSAADKSAAARFASWPSTAMRAFSYCSVFFFIEAGEDRLQPVGDLRVGAFSTASRTTGVGGIYRLHALRVAQRL